MGSVKYGIVAATIAANITLLGNGKKEELNPPAQDELRELLGDYPSVKEASFWKRALRRVCRKRAGPSK